MQTALCVRVGHVIDPLLGGDCQRNAQDYRTMVGIQRRSGMLKTTGPWSGSNAGAGFPGAR